MKINTKIGMAVCYGDGARSDVEGNEFTFETFNNTKN